LNNKTYMEQIVCSWRTRFMYLDITLYLLHKPGHSPLICNVTFIQEIHRKSLPDNIW